MLLSNIHGRCVVEEYSWYPSTWLDIFLKDYLRQIRNIGYTRTYVICSRPYTIIWNNYQGTDYCECRSNARAARTFLTLVRTPGTVKMTRVSLCEGNPSVADGIASKCVGYTLFWCSLMLAWISCSTNRGVVVNWKHYDIRSLDIIMILFALLIWYELLIQWNLSITTT